MIYKKKALVSYNKPPATNPIISKNIIIRSKL